MAQVSYLNPVMAAALAGIAPPAESPRVAHYRLALRAHDWRHEFAEGDARTRGRRELEALRSEQQAVDPDFRIWNACCHPWCTNGAAYPAYAFV